MTPEQKARIAATPCRKDGRCQQAVDYGTEGLAVCPKGKCVQPISNPTASPAATPIEPVTDDALGNPIGTAYLLKFPAGMQKYEFVSAYSYRTLEREVAELRGKLEKAQTMFDLIETNKRLLGKVQAAESALATAKKDERERCAKVADGYNYGPCGQYDYGYTDASAKADERASQIADDIRALKEEA